MTKKLSEKQESFIARSREHWDKQTTDMVNELVAILIKEKAPFLDVHYTFARAKEVLMEKVKKAKFNDKKINDARRNRLFESICQAKEVHVEMPADADERGKRSESIVQGLLDRIIDPETLFSDQDYIDDAIENDDQLLLAILADSYLNMIYDKLLTLIQFNEREANLKKWKKEREDITWDDMNNVLSKPK